MRKEPINNFRDNKQLNEYKDWWVEKLQLRDNIISVKLDNNFDEKLHGITESDFVNKAFAIKIKNIRNNDFIMKQPEELVLVHELLHCKIMGFENNSNIESVYYNEMQHQLLEEMAKALIMTKYNLKLDWFIN